jgi:uncharacterized protein
MRLVLDTNVLVSALLFRGGAPERLLAKWRLGAFELVTSEYVLDELSGAWKRLAARHQQTPGDLNDFLDLVRLRCEMAPVDAAALALAEASGLRDPDDAPILAMLIGSGADFLVTGDKDLLALAATFPILTPAAFEARFSP